MWEIIFERMIIIVGIIPRSEYLHKSYCVVLCEENVHSKLKGQCLVSCSVFLSSWPAYIDTSSHEGSRLCRKEKTRAWHWTLASCLIFDNRPYFSEPQFFECKVEIQVPTMYVCWEGWSVYSSCRELTQTSILRETIFWHW